MPNVISKMGFPSKSSLPVIIILTLFIVTFYNTHHRSPTTTTTTTTTTTQHKDKRTFHYFQSIFLSSASNYTLAAYLRDLTLHPHLAGTPPSLRTALYVRSHFESLGLQTYTTNHTVLLSYPLYSSLTAHFSNGSVINLPLSEPGASRNGVVAPYHAYSPSGSVLGQPVFLNHGRDQDYVAVGKHGVDVKGCIGIVRRGGGLSRNAVVEKAAAHGVVAVLMYTDGETFSGGVERGTVMKGLGDPLSPGWAGAEGGEKLRLNDPRVAERFPKVPSMPVSADTAETILGSMDGARMPQDWRGALKSRSSSEFGRVGPDRILLNFTYMGERKMATIHNIFAVIKGSEEPDRFILLGNHRDAWTYGAVDPNSGTSALLDVARRFALMMHLGWNPRRTIIFGSWDAEEFGMIGSTEWVEKNLMNLGAKAVAYLNVDCAVQGPGFFAGATPQLDDLLFEVTKKVKDPDSENVSIFETSKVFNEGINIQRLSGVDSDFAPFLQHAGVPSIDMYYGRDFPVYHTAFDSYDWMVSYGDPLFQRHVAVSGVWGLIALHLADDPILPFNYLSYADQLQEYTNTLNNVLEGDISLHPITLAIQDLRAAAAEIAEEIKKLSDDVTMDEFFLLKLRMLNDRLMFAERGFLDSEGLRGLQWFKHLVHGPQTNGESEVNSFPGVADAIYRSRWMNKEERKEAIEHEVWRVARAIQRASCLLKGDFT